MDDDPLQIKRRGLIKKVEETEEGQLWKEVVNVTAEAFKLAQLWLYAAHVQTWKGELVVQLHKGGKKMPVGQAKDLRVKLP